MTRTRIWTELMVTDPIWIPESALMKSGVL
jgi:hypothetical protein